MESKDFPKSFFPVAWLTGSEVRVCSERELR